MLFAERYSKFANTKIRVAVQSIAAISSVIDIAKKLSLKTIEERLKIDNGGRQGDIELIYESIVEPNLKDKDLQNAYGCTAPSDIVPMLFKTGEVGAIAAAIMRCAGYGQSVEFKIHDEVKNS